MRALGAALAAEAIGIGVPELMVIVVFVAVVVFIARRLISRKAKPIPPAKARRTVFISYRRKDSADITGRLTDRLVQHFGRNAVFKDVDSIPLGVDFRRQVQEAVGQCGVLIAVIGRDWAGAIPDSEETRLANPADNVRIEIESALERNVPIIPVLVQGAAMPRAQSLPESLRNLAYRNGIAVRPDPDFNGDMERLIRGIANHVGGASASTTA